jgi:hypothetical protein
MQWTYGFGVRAGGVALLAFGLAGCIAPQVPPDQRLTPTVEPTELETLDPFILSIDIGRWPVLMERAEGGLTLRDVGAEQPDAFADPGTEEHRAEMDAALRAQLPQLATLAARACAARLAEPDDCAAFTLPDWLWAQAEVVPDLATLHARSAWVGDWTNRFSVGPCTYGAEASADPLFCSVE